MADQNFILAPATVRISFRVDLVLYMLDVLLIVHSSTEGKFSGFSDWSTQAADQLSPEQRHTNALVMKVFNALIPDGNWSSFPDYIQHLENTDPQALRAKGMEWMCSGDKLPPDAGIELLSPDELLSDVQVFLDYHQKLHTLWSREESEDRSFDAAFYTELYHLLVDPQVLRARLVAHLRDMWDTLLAEDWRRSEPVLRESVEAFQQMNYTGLTAVEALRIVTGRDLAGIWDDTLNRAEELVFVPSTHIGPYVRMFQGRIARVVFRARMPDGGRRESSALSRSEMLVRLSALADDTRLQILELLTKHQELCAQDIMTALELSQSSTSRHLRQLTATGYLIERRREVAKCYSLNPARVEDTVQALQRFLAHKSNL